MNSRGNYLIAFVGFTVLLAGKDVISRYVLVHGVPTYHLLTVSGGAALIFSFLFSVALGQSRKVCSYRAQVVRLILDAVSWGLVAEAFRLLNATSISIVSKAYIPFLVLLGPVLGNHFSRKQNALALGSMVSMVAFAFFSRDPAESLWGYLYLGLAVLTVAAGYIMLRQSSLKESPFIVTATPALACLLMGVIGSMHAKEFALVPDPYWYLEILCGLLIYGLYTASIYRYKILPLGLAEYPTLLTCFLILPSEYMLFGWVPSITYIAHLGLTLIAIGLVVYWNINRATKPASG